MKVLVIDQCSNAKDYREDFTPFDAEAIDERGLEALREESQTPTKRSRDLYAGRQQTYVDEAVDKLRKAGDEVDRFFVSAGFGLVSEDEQLPPYDVTFADMSAAEIQERSEKLAIQSDVESLVGEDYDLVYFALGSDYYASIALPSVLDAIPPETWVVCFNQEASVEGRENAISLPARTEDAKEHGTIVVALKGYYLQNFAEHRSHGESVEEISDIHRFCTNSYTTQVGFDQLDSE